MRKSSPTTKFRRDVKRAQKQGRDLAHLKLVIQRLCKSESLEPQYHEHLLSGNYKGMKECHLSPDWLLIYEIRDNKVIFHRLGSHSELFKK